jgi:hypothetical protein
MPVPDVMHSIEDAMTPGRDWLSGRKKAPVALAIGIVVFLIVGHQIIKCEAVMGDHKVDAVCGLPAHHCPA